MILDRNENKEVVVLLGAGSMGCAIVRRIAAGKKILLASLSCLDGSKTPNPGAAYIVSKRANQLRVRTAAATTWADRGARINTISPGIIVTPLAYDEFNAPGNTYQNMIDCSAVRRAGTSDEIAAAGAFLLGAEAGFITGTDLLIDGGVIAALKSGKFDLRVR